MVSFSVDGAKLYVLPLGSDAQPVIVKDFSATLGQIVDMAICPDGHRLAASTLDGQIALIDLSTEGYPEERAIEPIPSGSGGWGVQFRPDNPSVLTSLGGDGTISVWDLDGAGDIAAELPQYDDWAAGIAISPDGRTLATIDCFGLVSLWDLSMMQPLGTVAEGPTATGCQAFLGVAFSHDGKLLAAGFEDGSVQILNVADRSVIHRFAGAGSVIVSLGFSPDDSVVGIVDQAATVSFRHLASGDDDNATAVHAFDDPITATAWSADGRFLITGDRSGMPLKIWDLRQPGEWSELPAPGLGGVSMYAVMFERSDTQISAVDILGQVLSWTKSGTSWTPNVLGDNRQLGPVISMRPLGNQMDVRLTTLNELGVYGPDSRPHLEVQLGMPNALGLSLIVSPDGTRVISAHSNRIIVWNLDPTTWPETACSIAGRNLSAGEWNQYFPDQPYRVTCPEFPPGYGVGAIATPVASPQSAVTPIAQ